MNSVILSGRLTKDIEIRTTSEGMAIGRTSIAVDDGYGEKKKTSFINLVAFGKTAESMEVHSFKGQKVIVEGKIQTGSYEKNGQKVYTTDVIINRCEYIDWKDKEDKPNMSTPQQMGFAAMDEDLPF